jgi:hypothetical protein
MVRSVARIAVSVAACAACVSVTTASAARQPTPAERTAVLAVVHRELPQVPAKCVRTAVTISNNGRYALARPTFSTTRACIRYAANGFFVLAKAPRWHVIYNGSDPPRCSLHVPRDLIKCRP